MNIRRPSTARSVRARSAFTLIELLVVIAIIAILAAILFPVFAQAREKARQTSCMSNIKQLGLGILQYNQDYDELMPLSFSDPGPNAQGGSQRGTWVSLCYPYTKSTGVWRCPDMVDATSGGVSLWNLTASSIGSSPFRNISIWEAYGFNRDYLNFSKPDCSDFGKNGLEWGPPTPLAAIQSPAATVMLTGVSMLYDGSGSANFGNGGSTLYPDGGGTYFIDAPAARSAPDTCIAYSNTGWGVGSTSGVYGGFEQPRHGMQGGNVCFCDGHSKFMTAGALAAGTNWTKTSAITAVQVTNSSQYLWDLN